MDIDLVEISKNNKGSAAVAFMSYTNMTNILKPTLFKTITSTNKTMMSTVVSASLPKTANTNLTKPVKITFKHINELDPEGILSCVHWKTDTWLEEGCSIVQTNSTHTVCSCDHLSTFALIMQTDPCRSDRLMNALFAVAIIVGLVFLSLSILTFTFYSRNPVTNAALINLCINLLLFHLLSLIKTLFLAHIHPLQLRAALAGVQWFFLMSVFVWMFIEAVLLYIFVKNLSEIRSNPGEVLSWKWLIVIGYLIPLGVLGMSGVRFPKGYIDEECWLNEDESLIFIFAGPLLFTVTLNLVPYLIIIIIIIFTLKHLKNEVLQISNNFQKNLIICVMLRSLTQFIILVCYWILLYIPSKNGVLYHAFQLLNSQQGTFIFLIHCLSNQEVRQKYRKVLCAFSLSNNPAATSRSVRAQPEDSQDN
ncbi:adhesion G protein-coupled receptor E3-like [Pangasianodon hypophthalmus]|uniref:adhesion G protein-coupled receptor E3-like n=1 Tax=Pangasianodon hypophthalmus TaxID=310915 RepID=UPI00147F92E1|nr:adhesion G protein-coupled receptor E3-like [Pangasianodon hypophthalmus]